MLLKDWDLSILKKAVEKNKIISTRHGNWKSYRNHINKIENYSDRPHCIYCKFNTRNNKIFYIGYTSRTIGDRAIEHGDYRNPYVKYRRLGSYDNKKDALSFESMLIRKYYNRLENIKY